MLFDHQVLTTAQVAQLGFDSDNAARHRLVILHRLRVADRFRPQSATGSAPFHYVLDEMGAAVVAAARGVEPAELGFRRERALALAHSPRLAHTVGVNGFFASLACAARRSAGAALTEWWPERRCAAQWGSLVRPDAYGRWAEGDSEVDFFLEYDRGTETTSRVEAKLAGYAELAAATGIATPVLIWAPTPAREASLRRALGRPAVPVATAATATSPAGPVWLPADSRGPRLRLAQLAVPGDRRPIPSASRLPPAGRP
ncbi:MAG: replication-relaxation family protein [Acidimicrobiales bacterium]